MNGGALPPDEGAADGLAGENRFLPTLAVLALIGLPFLVPEPLRNGVHVILAGLAVALMIAILLADPGRIDRRGHLIRGLSITLTVVLVFAAMVAAGTLVVDLLAGAPSFNSPIHLLTTGALVWLDTNITFSLFYWELDGGGPAERLHHVARPPDLAFVQHINPELAAPGWRPTFGDYLYLGHTNALAFSPTDVMPMTAWAKAAMAVQSVISVLILSLVVANAVNLLS